MGTTATYPFAKSSSAHTVRGKEGLWGNFDLVSLQAGASGLLGSLSSMSWHDDSVGKCCSSCQISWQREAADHLCGVLFLKHKICLSHSVVHAAQRAWGNLYGLWASQLTGHSGPQTSRMSGN